MLGSPDASNGPLDEPPAPEEHAAAETITTTATAAICRRIALAVEVGDQFRHDGVEVTARENIAPGKLEMPREPDDP